MTEESTLEDAELIQRQWPCTRSELPAWRWTGASVALSLAAHAFFLFLLAGLSIAKVEETPPMPPLIDTRADLLDGADPLSPTLDVFLVEEDQFAGGQQGSSEIVNGVLQRMSPKGYSDTQQPPCYTIWFGPNDSRSRGVDYAYVTVERGIDLERFAGQPVSIRGRLHTSKMGLFLQAVSLRAVSDPVIQR